ncbi:MAG TPA: hypothetical protein VFI73_11690 [Candidatus Nitrosopolaris sp.]|nr:hypothetical protein [Candidatus Nitrosopolaris sp.]
MDRNDVTPANIAASSPVAIVASGMSLERATTIWILGDMVQSGTLHLDERDPQLFFYEQLPVITSIGPWMNAYACMLHCPYAFSASVLGLQKAAMPGQRQTEGQRQLIAHSTARQLWRYATITRKSCWINVSCIRENTF